MKKSEIKNTLNEIIEELNSDIPIILLEYSSDVEDYDIGYSPKFIPNFPKDILSKINKDNIIENMSDTNRVILVPLPYFYGWCELNEEDLKVIIKHEYGHHLTWDDITEENRRDARFKLLIFDLIINCKYYEEFNDWSRLDAEYIYFSHRLPIERMASDIMNISLDQEREVIYHQNGWEVNNDLKYVDIDYLINKPVSIDTSKLPINESYDFIKEFTDDIILNETLRNKFLESI